MSSGSGEATERSLGVVTRRGNGSGQDRNRSEAATTTTTTGARGTQRRDDVPAKWWKLWAFLALLGLDALLMLFLILPIFPK